MIWTRCIMTFLLVPIQLTLTQNVTFSLQPCILFWSAESLFSVTANSSGNPIHLLSLFSHLLFIQLIAFWLLPTSLHSNHSCPNHSAPQPQWKSVDAFPVLHKHLSLLWHNWPVFEIYLSWLLLFCSFLVFLLKFIHRLLYLPLYLVDR